VDDPSLQVYVSLLRARIHVARGELEAALQRAREAKNFMLRAHAERRLGLPADAADSFRERALLSPKDFEALRDAAEAALNAAEALQTRQPEEARAWLHRARRGSREMTVLFPGRAASWELLARGLLRLAEAGAEPGAPPAQVATPTNPPNY
jgi:hypothetical protein